MSARPRGRTGFGPLWTPRQRYLLDHQLNPTLADAVRNAGWDILYVMELFNVGPLDSVPDELIIPRCAAEGRVWVTADEKVRREHEQALKLNLVSALWVRRPNEGMSTAYAHALLTTALLRVDVLLTQRPGYAQHYTVGPTLHAQPKLVWERRRPRR